MVFKIFWIIRYSLYSIFFKKAGFPGYLGSPIIILGMNKISIGKRVRIYPNVRLEVHGKDSAMIIEDNVGISQNVHITAGGNLVIKKSATILANTYITDIDHEYEDIDIPVLQQKMKVKKTEIGENCFIGMGVAIQAGTILGKQCIVGSNSVVRGIFPDYCVIAGTPAKIIKKYNFETKTWERVLY
ncbi:lipopolysaccharide biosynthesis protein [Chryseobacterium shigense]|uniref:Acetyltransferase (Isoleucine patch superfamily) n=1 Tax=Chryseobacterium shigense TaxID=297244 RepID=A0A1N7IKC2_9FLAO|nr:DapH/DapD/GlmU-related protein [Chryseobacterium shigense]PQA95869.1 lipopolysaccharide biosynthesis protein [Chryseobacterium shigense]SIS37535.1 Acetyltransferase (isoleucine patch superfamily) [Chryseobacterium shigense]